MITEFRVRGLDPNPDLWMLLSDKALAKMLGNVAGTAMVAYRDEIEPWVRQILQNESAS
jgi:hypothetical protein